MRCNNNVMWILKSSVKSKVECVRINKCLKLLPSNSSLIKDFFNGE